MAELALIFRAQDETSAVQAKVRAELEKTEAVVAKKASTFKLAREAAGAFAGVVGGVLVGALADAARAAAEDAASTGRLEQAVENMGEAYAVQEPLIAKRIALGQQLAFSDDMTRDSLSRLAPVSQSVTHALELEALAMEVARGRKIDLAAATEIVIKAQMGKIGALSKLGIELDKDATATQALAALQEKYGGQSAKYAEGSAGAIFRMKDSIDEWKESIGSALGPAQQYVAMLPGLRAGWLAATGAAGALWPRIIALTGSFWAMVPATLAAAAPFIAVAAAAALVVFALWQVAQTVGVVIDNWDKVTYVIGRKVEELKAFAGELLSGFGELGRSLVEGLSRGVADNWHLLLGPLGGLARGAVETVQRIWESRSPSEIMIDEGQNFAVGVAVGIKRRTPEVVRQARLLAAEGVEGTKQQLMDLAETMVVPAAVAVGRAIGAGMAKGIDDSKVILQMQLRNSMQELNAELARMAKDAAEQARRDAQDRAQRALEIARSPLPGPLQGGPEGHGGVWADQSKDPTLWRAQMFAIGLNPDSRREIGGNVFFDKFDPLKAIRAETITMIPNRHQGGPIERSGLYNLQAGEHVVPRSGGGGNVTVHVEIHGSAIGVPEIAAKVREAVAQGVQRGAFRGLIATETG